jgi:hypothetical protein
LTDAAKREDGIRDEFDLVSVMRRAGRTGFGKSIAFKVELALF